MKTSQWSLKYFELRYFVLPKKTDMKIIFQITRNHESESRGIEIERTARVRFSANENDLVERQRYDFETFMQSLKSKKIKFSGRVNDSKDAILFLRQGSYHIGIHSEILITILYKTHKNINSWAFLKSDIRYIDYFNSGCL